MDFKQMTTDKDYLKQVFLHFGITDVKILKSMLNQKINSVPEGIERTTWADFGPGIKSEIMRLKEAYHRRTEKIFKVPEISIKEE